MTEYKRSLELERAHVDPESGEFRAVLFTNGEASDGHILDMRGATLPDDMPLFVGHYADPVGQLGTLYPAERSESEIVYRGHIETGGEGADADIRRDMLLKMSNGHVKRMSGRWDADPQHVRRRSDLPKDHFAYVDGNAPQPQRGGSFFEQWTAVEGSIVGLGADPAATMRWARDASSEAVRDFWNDHAREQALTAFLDATSNLLERGLSVGEIIETLEYTYKIDRVTSVVIDRLDDLNRTIEDLYLSAYEEERVTAREEALKRETEREVAASLPALDMNKLAEMLRTERAESAARTEAMIERKIAEARGKVQR